MSLECRATAHVFAATNLAILVIADGLTSNLDVRPNLYPKP